MALLLPIASRVEAPVEHYVLVQESADREEWRCHFNQEMVSALFRHSHSYLTAAEEASD
jgi:hypothetical protein